MGRLDKTVGRMNLDRYRRLLIVQTFNGIIGTNGCTFRPRNLSYALRLDERDVKRVYRNPGRFSVIAVILGSALDSRETLGIKSGPLGLIAEAQIINETSGEIRC